MDSVCTPPSLRPLRRRGSLVALAAAWSLVAVVSCSPPDDPADGLKPTAGANEPQSLGFDFRQLEQSLCEHGVDAVITTMNARIREGGDRRLVAALDHLRPMLREHPDQLWFQLKAHTRLKGWEDIQEQLAASRPAEMLVASTSLLQGPCPGVLRSWKFGKRAVSHLRMSSDMKQLYCGTASGDFLVIDPATGTVVRRQTLEAGILATGPGPNGGDCVVVLERPNPLVRGTFAAVRDIQTNATIARIKDTFKLEDRDFGTVPPPMCTTPDGQHIVYWYGTAFVDRELANLANSFRFRSRTEPSTLTPVFLDFLDAGRMISVDEGGYVRLFAYPGGKELYPPRRIADRVTSLAVGPDRSMIACCDAIPAVPSRPTARNTARQGNSPSLLVWDLSKREEVTRFPLGPETDTSRVQCLTALAFQSKETLVSGSQSGEVQRWRVGTPTAISTIAPHRDPILFVAPTLNDEHVFTADRAGNLKLVDLASKDVRAEPLPPGNVRPFRTMASWDGSWEVGSSGRVVNVWDARTDERLLHLEIPQSLCGEIGGMKSFGIDLERDYVVLGGQDKIGHWDLRSEKTESIDVDTTQIRRHPGRNRGARLPIYVSPDGKHAVAWEGQTLGVFDPESGQQKHRLQTSSYLGGVHFFLDGERLAVTFRDSPHFGVRVFDLARGTEIAVHTHGFFQNGVAFAYRAGVIVTGGKRGHRNVSEPDTIAIWKPGEDADFLDAPDGVGVSKVGVNRDASRAVTISNDGIVLLWDLEHRKVLRRFDLGVRASSLAFDGRTLVVTESDKTTKHRFEYR